MNRRITLISRRVLPLWLIIILLAASGVGAAVGSTIAGKISGSITVSTTGSGPLLVGSPLSDTFRHFPDSAIEDSSDYTLAEDPTTAWPLPGFTSITDFEALLLPDGEYETTEGVALNNSQQIYQFYVGPAAADISRLLIVWEGYTEGPGTIQVWNSAASAWGMAMSTYTAEDRVTINLTGSTDTSVSEAANNGYVYVQASTIGVNLDLHTDYVTVTAIYKEIDLANWTYFNGPEIFNRLFVVPERHTGTHSDDQTAFEAAAELAIGDWWLFALPIKNAGTSEVVAKFTLTVPTDLNVYVMGADEMGCQNARITSVVRIGENVWKLLVDADAEKLDENDYLYIAVNAHDDGFPADLVIQGILEQISY